MLPPRARESTCNAVWRYPLDRVRSEMTARHVDALILSDAVNVRYTTGALNMQIFTSRNAASRYLLLTADRSILYEFTGCERLADGLDTIDEVRSAHTAGFVAGGPRHHDQRATLGEGDGGDDPQHCRRRHAHGRPRTTQRWHRDCARRARRPHRRCTTIRGDDALHQVAGRGGVNPCIRASLRATERGVAKLRDAIKPGITEAELWSVLHQSVIADKAGYCETRLLNSGPRTTRGFKKPRQRSFRQTN